MTAVSPTSLTTAGPTNATPFTSRSSSPTASADATRAAAGLTPHGEQERRGEARAERVGEQVVGLARGEAGRVVLRVGEAEAHARATERPAPAARRARRRPRTRDAVGRTGSSGTSARRRTTSRVLLTNGTCRRSMLRPAKPSTAGSRVSDAAMRDQDGEHDREGETVHGRLTHQQDAEHGDDDGRAPRTGRHGRRWRWPSASPTAGPDRPRALLRNRVTMSRA